MDILAVVFSGLGALLLLYVAILRLQIRRMRHQLEQRQIEGTRQPLSLELLDAELNRLAASINRSLSQEQLTALESLRHEKQFKEMIMSISHDLRTPLTAIVGNLQLLEGDVLGDSQRARLAVIRRQADELSRLVEHFWEYAYYSIAEPALEPERLNLTNLVAECVADHVPQLEARGLVVHYDAIQPLYVRADRECVIRIVRNLIRNAALHAVGDIEIAITSASNRISLVMSNPVAPESNMDAARIFDRFYSADPSRGKAAGLGLAIVKLLAQSNGGDVGATANNGILEIRVDLPNA